MHFHFRNVNEAFQKLNEGILRGKLLTDVQPSRAGEVVRVDQPVLITYDRPRERVLSNPARDANPFFHLYEALWMIAGRNDVAPLAYYNSKIVDIASDDGKTLNGAYGYRWRRASSPDYDATRENGTSYTKVDQLSLLVDHLRNNPDSRRAVLQMWTVENDLFKIDTSKDVCCNTCVYFDVEDGYLNMTVCNRSNDMILGMLGANYVHFTILQEYLASHLELQCGSYHHFTNNLHVYTNNWKPEEYLQSSSYASDCWYEFLEATGWRGPTPLVYDPVLFDDELPYFVKMHSRSTLEQPSRVWKDYVWKEPFLETVAKPMLNAYHAHKVRDYPLAHKFLGYIASLDWKTAACQWIGRRQKKWANRTNPGNNPYLAREQERQRNEMESGE